MTATTDAQQLAYIAGQAADARVNVELETEGMTLNIGPQHPATHGTLRIIVRLDGTNSAEGRAILEPHLSDHLRVASDMLEGARQAVALAAGEG